MRDPVGGRHILGAGDSAGAFTAWAQPGVTDTVQLLRGVIESVTAAPSGATVVVGVDDVHLLDDLSTFVVHQIVQRGGAKLILTVRDGEPIPSAITEIWKVGRFERLEVQPLSMRRSDAVAIRLLWRNGGSLRRPTPVDADSVAMCYTCAISSSKGSPTVS